MNQLKHEEVKHEQKKFPIVVVGDTLRTPQNVGMCLRVCEAFGIDTFYTHELSPDLNNRIVQRTARNTEKNITIQTYDDPHNLITQLKKEGYQILALEITQQSKNINAIDFKMFDKIALLIGSERFGIEESILEICDTHIHINMFGKNSSMNVVNSLGIALYEITKQLNTNI